MRGLPATWQLLSLGSVSADISYGFTTPATNNGSAPKLLRITDIQESKVDWRLVPRCTDEPPNSYLLRAGDILIARTGATTGKSFLIDFNPEPTVFASYLIRVRVNESVEARYLWWFLQSEEYWKQIQFVSKGTAQPGANATVLSQLQVPVPPIAEQRRIVAKLDNLAAPIVRAREQLGRIPKLIQKYREAILSKAFDGVFAGVASVGQIPLSAYVKSLDQGWSPKCESVGSDDPKDWAVIKTTAIQPIHFFASENKKLPSALQPRNDIQIQPGDILITRAGPRSRVGISCVVTAARPRLMLCDKAYRVRTKDGKADPTFLAMMLNSPQALRQIEEMKTGISDSGLNLTQEKFLNLSVPELDLEQQQLTVRRIETAFAWLDRIVAEHANASRLLPKLDQAILTKAFRGELVPQDPHEKPVEFSATLTAEDSARRGRPIKQRAASSR